MAGLHMRPRSRRTRSDLRRSGPALPGRRGRRGAVARSLESAPSPAASSSATPATPTSTGSSSVRRGCRSITAARRERSRRSSGACWSAVTAAAFYAGLRHTYARPITSSTGHGAASPISKNLALVCHTHHRWIHDNDITLERGPHGWKPPLTLPPLRHRRQTAGVERFEAVRWSR